MIWNFICLYIKGLRYPGYGWCMENMSYPCLALLHCYRCYSLALASRAREASPSSLGRSDGSEAGCWRGIERGRCAGNFRIIKRRQETALPEWRRLGFCSSKWVWIQNSGDKVNQTHLQVFFCEFLRNFSYLNGSPSPLVSSICFFFKEL